MRSQILLRRTRSLLKHPSLPHRALISSTRVARYPRKDPASVATPRLSKRSSSSVPTASGELSLDAADESPNLLAGAPPQPPESPEDPEKPKRRTRTSAVKDSEASPLPNDLDILWLPQDAPTYDVREDAGSSTSPPSALPPPELMHEVLTNLHLTLHPQTQHRAAYATGSGPPIEPSLALYCPIEGGDYVIDATVRELGRQSGAEVVVLDAVHLAAGECGHFSKAASVLQLQNNPLHFPAPSSPRSSANPLMEEDDDDDDSGMYRGTSQLTLHVLAPMSTRSGRTMVATPRKTPSSMAKVKAFFDDLINIQAPVPEGSTDPPARPPRIIYIRDFPTLAASSASWYPALLAAVRARRQGPLPRQTSPVHSPTTIIFGMTPPLAASASPSSAQSAQGLLSYMMNRQNVAVSGPPARSGKSEFSEDEVADKARERRLKERLRRWERGDPSLLEELPQLSTESESDAGPPGSGVMIVGGGEPDGLPAIPAALARAFGGRLAASRGSSPEETKPAKFFRTSVIVPGVRSLLLEKACRVDRRREINELTMRMGVASVGGTLPGLSRRPDELEEGVEPDPAARRMWEAWGRHIEVWSNVRNIADRAVGKTIATRASSGEALPKASLDSVAVEWDVVYEAWVVHKAARDMRKAWIQQSSTRVAFEQDEDGTQDAAQEAVDEVVERLKRDPELDSHEQRLLSCIVDAKSIPTTFSQVHLPERTVDSVRTIVSLPLLHPSAFQHGILKEHAMTGCLLFGPPGTGKTLVVRALAKEAGCRMLAVSPSDVMDMYVGEGEKLVRSVFALARRLSPCVVFIDEIDALFGARMTARESGGAIAHRGVITEFMQEMDGLKSKKDDNIVVIGATNRPFDLDDAVLRRLPRRLLVDLPGEKERGEILKILLREEPLAPDVDLKLLARRTETFSGSDLKHLCVSAALDAVKERVEVPWRPSKPASAESSDSSAETSGVAATVAEAEATETKPLTVSATSATPATSSEVTPTTEASGSDVAPATESSPEPNAVASTAEVTAPVQHRVLHWRNFLTALKEITPSSSESLGSLSDLRKWNEEFGEGRKGKKKQVWGKGRFGFVEAATGSNVPEDGRVSAQGSRRD